MQIFLFEFLLRSLSLGLPRNFTVNNHDSPEQTGAVGHLISDVETKFCSSFHSKKFFIKARLTDYTKPFSFFFIR